MLLVHFHTVQTISIDTWIAAPLERCFDAATDIDLHVRSLAHTNETAGAGRISGLIGPGEEVTWRGRHFGIYQHFTSQISAYARPHHFQDSMRRGAFESFVHDHYFMEAGAGTHMRDVVVFAAPLGFLGRVMEQFVLRAYVERLLTTRALVIKNGAEAGLSAC
jgi:ligand-binding SRPBCC domain-containing protein